MNPRLVICLLGAMVAGLSAAGAALAVNAGPVLALFIYSGVGSTTLVTLTLAWPERRPALVGPIDGPALA